jgi:TonB family protein
MNGQSPWLVSLLLVSIAPCLIGAQSRESPLRAGGSIAAPARKVYVRPNYTAEQARSKRKGSVVLELLIDPQGRVSEVKPRKEVKDLTAAAVAAAQQWTFEPTVYKGAAAWVVTTVVVTFPPQR